MVCLFTFLKPLDILGRNIQTSVYPITMTDLEQQEEEREVLSSIYDGDAAFRMINPTTFQYKDRVFSNWVCTVTLNVLYSQYGETGDPKSFLLEISWGPNYPSEKPLCSMDTFYNKHIVSSAKEKVVEHVMNEAEQWLGSAMTYTLFESVKEQYVELLASQPDVSEVASALEQVTVETQPEIESRPKERKEQLTKAQKRRQWDRADAKGGQARGWDWVDVVKHLSQTGSKADS